MALDEIISVFQEGIAGGGAGPGNRPLGHVGGDAVIGLLCLAEDGSTEQAAGIISAGIPGTKAEAAAAARVAADTMTQFR